MINNKVFNMSYSFSEIINFVFLFLGSFGIFLISLFLFFKVSSDVRFMEAKIQKYNKQIAEKESIIMHLETIFNSSTTHLQIKNFKKNYKDLTECKVYNALY